MFTCVDSDQYQGQCSAPRTGMFTCVDSVQYQGQIKLIEVNGCMSSNLSGLYAACLSVPRKLHVLLGLCCGVLPPPPFRGDYTGKVGDMVNEYELEILKKGPDVKITWIMSFDDEFLPGKTEFAKVWTYGTTPDEAKKNCREVMQRVVKKHEHLKLDFP
ncbi:hypothetical protein Bbelb_380070 [Branchiostoma belcheri]|nr:hypothetical protein Bbelb_380070 [Branchiostoma belcheri]